MMLRELATEIFDTATEKGFYDDGPKNFGMTLMLVVSELAEALEEYRDERPMLYFNEDKPDKPEGKAVEMADAMIRILDWFASNDVDPDYYIRLKMNYNKSRPYKHNKIV